MTTTTKLNKPRARTWYDLPLPVSAGICVFALYLIVGLAFSLRSAPSAPPIPTPALAVVTIGPIIVIQKEAPVPTSPPQPTATPQVIYVEVPAPPEIVYVEVAAPPAYVEAPVEAAPTPAPEQYTVTNESPAGLAQQAILDRNQWASMAATARAAGR